MEIFILIVCLLILILLVFLLFQSKNQNNDESLRQVHNLQSEVLRLEREMKDGFRNQREDALGLSKMNREELADALFKMNEQLQSALKSLHDSNVQKSELLIQRMEEAHRVNRIEQIDGLQKFSKDQTASFSKLQQEQKDWANQTIQNIKSFSEAFDKNVHQLNELQREQFGRMEIRQQEMVKQTEDKLEKIRVTVEEKLEKTLSDRLGQSFETVGKQLIEVQKGLGEMQAIATDVGGLKKVLSNVKLRGGIGEVQLALLLEQTLAPNQYEANVRTKAGSADPVEFAIKLPGRTDDAEHFVYLPIDAKFPKEAYEHLLAAYEIGNVDEIEIANKNMEATIKKMAKDIRDKYIDPPNTTDFAIMFLPFESIYAQVISRTSLLDQLRDEFKITVAGPTTFMALLNSLQMGFRTLALQKRSSEVWNVLSKVKGEFEKFGGLLEKAQKNFQTGLGQIDDLIGTRTRAIQRQLRNVEIADDEETENSFIEK